MKVFYLVWVAALLLLVGVSLFFTVNPTIFYGIAESREIVVNTENAAEISRIEVVQGQTIHKGDVLVRLKQPRLTMRINEIFHNLNELQSQDALNLGSSRAQIRQLEAEKAALENEFLGQIQELESQYQLNRELASQLKSIDSQKTGGPSSQGRNPIQQKIAALRKEMELALDPFSIKIQALKQSLASGENPLTIQIQSLEKELRLLREEEEKLVITSPITGVVGSVNFKEGETVSPFTSILTVSAKSPSYVKGYIHENIYSKVEIGQQVDITSVAEEDNKALGEVVGVGSRIIEYPMRLRKRQDIQIWGREVIIKIPEENSFLLGEKVLISPRRPVSLPISTEKLSGLHTLAGSAAVGQTPEFVTITGKDGKAFKGLEASGAFYLTDIDKYLIVSDETEKKKPVLYLMNGDGVVEQTLGIAGLESIDDMEGISGDDVGNLYIISSQSVTKKRQLPENRRLLVRVTRTGTHLMADRTVILYDKLDQASRNFPSEDWAAFLQKAIREKTMDVEGVAVDSAYLYLGFKNPLLGDKAVVLRVNGDALFNNASLSSGDIVLWRSLYLKKTPGGLSEGITDMLMDGDVMYITSYSKKKDKEVMQKRGEGNLWRYFISTGKLELLCPLEGQKPEAVSLNRAAGQLLVAFDNDGEGDPQMLKISLPKNAGGESQK